MLPSYFDYIFEHPRQKVRLKPELSPKFLSTLGPNLTRKARPDLLLCFLNNLLALKQPCTLLRFGPHYFRPTADRKLFPDESFADHDLTRLQSLMLSVRD